MSEKRFTLVGGKNKFNEILVKVYDNFEEEVIEKQKVVDKLNEQQALISALKKENKQLKAENNTPLPYVETGLKFARAEQKISEQQATIEHLTKSRDKWSRSAKLHSEYFDCLEKAIEIAYEEKPYPKIEDIMTIYSKLEKEINDE